MSRCWLRSAALILSGAAALSAAVGPAHALSPDQQGWWIATVPVLGATPPPPPDVPPDGLLVQGGADPATPTAFAALTYQLPAATAAAATLTLTVAPGSASIPGSSLQLCPLSSSFFVPAQGGSTDNAPAYDCSTHVTGTASADGHTYAFAVGPLVSGGGLAVAILPGGPTDRVVLTHPGPDALPISGEVPVTSPSRETPGPASSSPIPPAPTDAGAITAPVSSGGSDATTGGEMPVQPPGGAVTAMGAPVPQVAPDPATSALGPATTQGFAAAVSNGGADGPSPVAIAGLVAGVLVAAVAWILAQRGESQ